MAFLIWLTLKKKYQQKLRREWEGRWLFFHHIVSKTWGRYFRNVWIDLFLIVKKQSCLSFVKLQENLQIFDIISKYFECSSKIYTKGKKLQFLSFSSNTKLAIYRSEIIFHNLMSRDNCYKQFKNSSLLVKGQQFSIFENDSACLNLIAINWIFSFKN